MPRKDPQAYRDYKRDQMRRRRAAAKSAQVPLPPPTLTLVFPPTVTWPSWLSEKGQIAVRFLQEAKNKLATDPYAATRLFETGARALEEVLKQTGFSQPPQGRVDLSKLSDRELRELEHIMGLLESAI